MQENNEQVVNEEVKPVEVVPTEVQAAPEVQTVDVDQIVGNPVESNNNNMNNMNNKNSRRSPRELVLIVIAALTMIASGVYFAFFNEDEEEATGNNKAETVEKEDEKETTDDETQKDDNTSDNNQNKSDTQAYVKPDENSLKNSSIKIADMFVFATQFNLKTGKITEMDNKQLINMTMLYLQESSVTCYDKNDLDTKAKELFGVELKSDDLPEGITFENSKYCKTTNWGAGGNTNPLTLSDSKLVKDNDKVVYEHIYSYENNKTIINLEYKLENDHYVLVSVSKN